jgi:hypothetical protein
VTNVTENLMKAGFHANLEKAKKAMEDAKGATTAAASQMFTFYLTCCLPRASTHGTRLSASRWKATRLLT